MTAPPSAPCFAWVVDTIGGAPLRYRVQTPAAGLVRRGLSTRLVHVLDPDLERVLGDADVVIVARCPATPRLVQVLSGLRDREDGPMILADYDDPLFDVPAGGQGDREDEATAAHRSMIRLCGRALASTPAIARAARRHGVPAAVFRNGLHPALVERSDQARRIPRVPGPPRIAFLDGSATHAGGLEALAPAICDVLGSGSRAHLWLFGLVGGGPRIEEALGDRVRRVPFMDWTDLPRWERQMDLVLAPNADAEELADTKSTLTWLEAAALGVPTIARATEPYRQEVEDGKDAVLVGDGSAQAWGDALGELVQDKSLRRRIGRAARDAARARGCERVTEDLLDAVADLEGEAPADVPHDAEVVPDKDGPLGVVPPGVPGRLKPRWGIRTSWRVARGSVPPR